MNSLKKASIFISGGTGSFGREMAKTLLRTDVSRIVIFSRDELKQFQLRNELPKDERLRFFIGDIRDKDRLKTALHGVSHVIHAAALKQVDTGEYNPMEFIQTNIIGSSNLIEAGIRAGVSKVVALSTDKASSPINLYGATKLTADKLFTSANNYAFSYGTHLSVVRYGNVMGSRGSVIPFFRNLYQKRQPIPITDSRMTRFWITIQQAVNFVLETFDIMKGGELYVPKIPSMRITDLAEVIAPGALQIETGIRPGEKLHEEMISPDDSRRTIELENRYVVNPILAEWGYQEPVGVRVPEGFSYKSDTNPWWLGKNELSEMLAGIPDL